MKQVRGAGAGRCLLLPAAACCCRQGRDVSPLLAHRGTLKTYRAENNTSKLRILQALRDFPPLFEKAPLHLNCLYMWGGFLNSLYTNIFIKSDGKWGVAYFFNPGTNLLPPSPPPPQMSGCFS